MAMTLSNATETLTNSLIKWQTNSNAVTVIDGEYFAQD
jgi:hypothetical protein